MKVLFSQNEPVLRLLSLVMTNKTDLYIASTYIISLLDMLIERFPEYIEPIKALRQEVENTGKYTNENIIKNILEEFSPFISDSDFALNLGQSLTLETHGFLGYAAKSCSTIREAVFLDTKYLETQISMLKFDYVEYEKRAEVTCHFLGLANQFKPFFSECLTASIVSMLKQMTDTPIQGELFLEHERTAEHSLYEKYIPFKINFSERQTKLVFPKEFLDLKVRSEDNTLKSMAEDQCVNLLSVLPKKKLFIDEVASIIKEHLRSPLSQEQIAEQLHCSLRTLKRRLKHEGTSYRALLDKVREEQAKRLLEDGRFSIDYISEALGYSESPAFIKAFRRWTKQSPSEYKSYFK